MNQPPNETENISVSLAALSRAVRFGMAAFVLGLSYPNIHCAFRIHKFGMVFDEMIHGTPLPAITVFAVRFQAFFVGLSIALPVAAIVALFLRGATRPIYFMGVLVLLTFLEIFFEWHALIAPLFTVIQAMSSST